MTPSFKRHEGSRGAVTLLVLVFLMLFSVLMIAWIRYIAGQVKQTVNQEQARQAFHAADAGVAYAGWLVSPSGGNVAASQLTTLTTTHTHREVTNPAGQVVGFFDLAFTPVVGTTFTVTSVGRDSVQPTFCEVVTAAFTRDAASRYVLTAWDHKPGYPCTGASPLPTPTPAVTPTPTPLITPTPTVTPTPTPGIGLAGYWKFDEGSGSTATDSSGNGNHGTLVNGPIWSTATSATITFPNPRAIEFDGINDYTLISTFPKSASAVTVSAWVRADTVTTGFATIAKNWGNGTAGQFHFGLYDQLLTVYLRLANDTQLGPLQDGSPLPAGAWQHVAFVADGSQVRLYRNGTQVGTPLNYSGTLKTSFPCLGVGAKPTDSCASVAGEYFDGRIDDLRVYNVALTPAQIQTLANGQSL